MHTADEKKGQHVTLMMMSTELQRLDDWAFAKRLRSRAEAIGQLISAATLADFLTGKPAIESPRQDLAKPGGR